MTFEALCLVSDFGDGLVWKEMPGVRGLWANGDIGGHKWRLGLEFALGET